jgi:2-dehydro-3-deoxy-D-arabinonate dehydratase
MSEGLKLYRTSGGSFVQDGERWFELPASAGDWARLTAREDLYGFLAAHCAELEETDAPPVETWLAPIARQEVWAAGVTYFRSRTARMEESEVSGAKTFYDLVYNAERPELFFKATPHRVVKPGAAVKIRSDSKWNVPEPELVLLLTPAGKLIGYTVGNDVSSRDIEGENPLYLPQAKVYERSCSLGPCVLVRETPLAGETAIRLVIERGGATIFRGETTLSQIKRPLASLVEFLFRDNLFPDGVFLFTGTGIVPDAPLTLERGDISHISIAGIGTLTNKVD